MVHVHERLRPLAPNLLTNERRIRRYQTLPHISRQEHHRPNLPMVPNLPLHVRRHDHNEEIRALSDDLIHDF